MATLTQHIKDGFNNRYIKSEVDTKITNVSNTGKSAMLSGDASVTNTTLIAGMSTALWTSTGGTVNINAGVDCDTQWGDSANERCGCLHVYKDRTLTNVPVWCDSIRGATHRIYSSLTNAEATTGGLNSFTSTGAIADSSTANVGTSDNIVSWIFQTTHRILGTTNHGKNYTCHYNPITGFTIVKYEGSGIAGHEIQHHLGRKLGIWHTKNLSTTSNWWSDISGVTGTNGDAMYLNLTNAKANDYTATNGNDNISIIVGTSGMTNTSGNSYIIYGWANSYYDADGVLNGNYEVGVYQGAVIGTKVLTRRKPAWIMVKRLDNTESWAIVDNARNDYALFANLSQADIPIDYFDFVSDGFILKANSTAMGAIGGRYLYMVVYDNDNASGKSKFSMASETSNIQLNNLVVSFTNGVGTNGVVNTVKSFGNITFTPSTGWKE